MSLSSWDDLPVHQAPLFVSQVASSDRNFYDRYYFNAYTKDANFFAIFGLGQYPNLGVIDAFCDVRRGTKQFIVRSSAPLIDRADVSVGPFHIEVIEPLERLRVIIDEGAGPVSMDLEWRSHIRATAEPHQFLQNRNKVIFDTQRFVQTGTWEGTLKIDGESQILTHQNACGNRDRSWGIRPVGEPEPGGIREGEMVLPGMWNYYPMMFDDHAVIYICNEKETGLRPLVEAKRVWCDPNRGPDDLGPMNISHTVKEGTRIILETELEFPSVTTTIHCEPILTNFVSVGTGYGIDSDWRHGMYQGPEVVTQGLTLDVDDVIGLGQYGIIDHLASFTYGENRGMGLLEQGFFGPFPKCNMFDSLMGATPPTGESS